MSVAREGSFYTTGHEMVSHVTSVSLAAIPRLKCGAFVMIAPAFRSNVGTIAFPIAGACG
jgi:hypothetical protein